MTDPLEAGRIVWAEIADAGGNPKLRPAVIVTPTAGITSKHLLDVVAVTSRLSDPIPVDHVMLPWHPKGHTRTGLNRRCAAVCTRIGRDDIREIGGVIPGRVLLDIIRKVATGLSPPLSPPSDTSV